MSNQEKNCRVHINLTMIVASLISIDIKLEHGWAGQLDQYWYHTWSWLTLILFMLVDMDVVRGWRIMLIKFDQAWSSMMKYHGWSSLMHHTRPWLMHYQAWNIMMHQVEQLLTNWTLINLEASSLMKVDRSSTLVQAWYQVWTRFGDPSTLMNHQTWSSIKKY